MVGANYNKFSLSTSVFEIVSYTIGNHFDYTSTVSKTDSNCIICGHHLRVLVASPR